ncbi:hypothetical protein E6H36_00690 [Candidatus Bathyarchaeota archaeon]|nr:MAG: hypothetical protein E6H36_00690 [Candidatus Bathyarchaeota archaeon]
MKTTKGVLVVLVAVLATIFFQPGHSILSPQESAILNSGDKLVILSDQSSIQTVVVRGNLTAASWSKAYFSRNFTLTSNSTSTYTLNIWSSYPGPYTTSVNVRDHVRGSSSQVASYFVSGGDLNLTVLATFQAPGPGSDGSLGLPSFYEWVSQFGGAFPVWVKLLYLVLGVQFAFVGFNWVKFEDERRRIEGHLPPLDLGNKIYLWTDVAFRALLVGFAISLSVMVGEALIVGLAQYLFLVNLTIVPLLDFFSLFFFAVVAALVYLAREGMDRLLDLKPIMED